MQADTKEDQQHAVRTQRVIAEAESVYRRVLDAAFSVRGYLLTQNPVYAKSFHEARSELPKQIEHLEQLLTSLPARPRTLTELGDKVAKLLNMLADQERLIQQGEIKMATAGVTSVASRELMEEIRKEIDALMREEEKLNVARLDALQRSSTNQLRALAGGGVASLVVTFGLAVLFFRGITGRLAVLRDNARRFAEGKELAQPVTGSDEIAETDRAFRNMAARLHEQRRENEMFVYSVSHDLRSPLVNLQGFSQELVLSCQDLRAMLQDDGVPEVLRARVSRLLDKNIDKSVHYIQVGVSRLSAIIDAMLRLSRAGRVVYQFQTVALQAVLQRITEALQVSIREQGAQVIVHELPEAWGDPTALEQLFANLLANAVQYLEPERPGKVEVGWVPSDSDMSPEFHTYYVKDNGRGIPVAFHEKIFSAFQRLHGDSSRGEGVGLALVHRIVERHGGRLWVESVPGVGSTFYVALPARPLEKLSDSQSGTQPLVPKEVPAWPAKP
jgi:signal transduction histidine kinase